MASKTFRKKPVVVQAVQWTGINEKELREFAGSDWDYAPGDAEIWDKLHDSWISVKLNNWVIQGLRGEFYPCEDSVFKESYEEVSNV